MRITGKDNSIIEGEESHDVVIGNRAEHLRWLYHVCHDPLIRIPERRSTPTAQQSNATRQPYEYDTEGKTTEEG